jgi:ATPase subunit of ABC transporter with duplicated ATPase domains
MKYTADEMNHGIGEMSGGQKAKLLLLKLSLDGCNVLILDEPTRNFSPISNPAIRDVLKSYGGTVISISHDRKFINEVCNKIYTLTEIGLIPKRIPV